MSYYTALHYVILYYSMIYRIILYDITFIDMRQFLIDGAVHDDYFYYIILFLFNIIFFIFLFYVIFYFILFNFNFYFYFYFYLLSFIFICTGGRYADRHGRTDNIWSFKSCGTWVEESRNTENGWVGQAGRGKKHRGCKLQ